MWTDCSRSGNKEHCLYPLLLHYLTSQKTIRFLSKTLAESSTDCVTAPSDNEEDLGAIAEITWQQTLLCWSVFSIEAAAYPGSLLSLNWNICFQIYFCVLHICSLRVHWNMAPLNSPNWLVTGGEPVVTPAYWGSCTRLNLAPPIHPNFVVHCTYPLCSGSTLGATTAIGTESLEQWYGPQSKNIQAIVPKIYIFN